MCTRRELATGSGDNVLRFAMTTLSILAGLVILAVIAVTLTR